MPEDPIRRLWGFFALVVFSLAVGTPTECEAARWYEDYDLAVEHIEAGQCSTEAIEALGAAVVDKSKPKRGVRTYAQRRIDYLPYYQLARAHLLCGNTDLASQYLERSRSFNIASEAELSPVEARLKTLLAATNVQPTAPPIDREALDNRLLAAQQNLEAARGALSSTDASLAEANEVGTGNPRWSDQRDNSASRIDSLADALSRYHEEGDLLALADAAHSATEITRSLDQLTVQINQSVKERRAALEPKPTSPMVVAQVRPTPTPRSHRPTTGNTTDPTPTPALISNDLRTAAAAFLAGNYDSVTTILERVSLANSKAQAAALMIRGAAHLSLAMTEENSSSVESHTEKGKTDLWASRRLNPEIRPDPSFFPPPVIEVFNQAGS
jgi:hypothetical protein